MTDPQPLDLEALAARVLKAARGLKTDAGALADIRRELELIAGNAEAWAEWRNDTMKREVALLREELAKKEKALAWFHDRKNP